MIPVNLRPLDRPVPAELGNDFALVLLGLPLGGLRRPERLRQVNSGDERDQGLAQGAALLRPAQRDGHDAAAGWRTA